LFHLRSDLPEFAKHVLEDADPDFASKMQKGDFVVAGNNFGLGSSREHAPQIIKIAGVGAVIAKSFARIFYRNAINIGLGARIVKITDQCKRFWGVKFLSYFMAFISLIFERKLYRMHLKINGEHIRGRIMTVCIGSAWGYGQAPSAVPYNGWLDVSVIYRPELLQLFSGIWMLMEGRILNHKVVKPYRTQKIKVLRAQNASVDLDGRILDRHFPLDIGVLHEAITLIIPN
jgi:diacylglycerol kinase family enzyme